MTILYAILGIALVIFVHELGHFLAARLCGVRVETFSIGFGPRLFVWRRGDTEYQVALLPLGGYVKMAGEGLGDDGLPRDPDAPPRPDELRAKSVGQRALIFAGGVIMNVVFGLVVFPVVLLAGVPMIAPVIGAPAVGSPAWHAGLTEGTEVLRVDGERVIDFQHVETSVAFADPSGVELEVLRPGATETERVTLVPVPGPMENILWLGSGIPLDPEGRIVVAPGGAAARAGLATGDRLLALRDGLPGVDPREELRYRQSLGQPEELPTELLVASAADGVERWVTLPALGDDQLLPGPWVVGVSAPTRRVVAVRNGSRAEALGLEAEDRIESVDDEAVWAWGDLRRALLARAGAPLELGVRRGGATIPLAVPALDAAGLLDLIDGIGLEADREAREVVVGPSSAAARAGMVTGDRVVRVAGGASEDFGDVLDAVAAARPTRPEEEPRPVEFTVLRLDPEGGLPREHRITVRPAREPFGDLGLVFEPARRDVHAESLGEAVLVGAACTWRFLEDAFRFVGGVVNGTVSGKAAGGIITIGVASVSWAGEGLAKLFFFLGILSMNLAFLNVLPIPLLDGGHLFFLLLEKLRGRPVSERVQGYTQLVGLVLVLSLMLYITYNDVVRWFFPGA